MNWEAIGSIGEIIGALAVLGTLIYIALQVADAKTTLGLQASQNINDQFNLS